MIRSFVILSPRRLDKKRLWVGLLRNRQRAGTEGLLALIEFFIRQMFKFRADIRIPLTKDPHLDVIFGNIFSNDLNEHQVQSHRSD